MCSYTGLVIYIVNDNTCFTLLLFPYLNISQGSVTMHLRFDGSTTNLLMNMTVKEFLKSVNTGRSYWQKYNVFVFFNSQCILGCAEVSLIYSLIVSYCRF